MDGTFPEIACMLCSSPVNLQTDLCTDENGQAVHENCYVNRLLAAPAGHPVAEKLFDVSEPRRRLQSPINNGSLVSYSSRGRIPEGM